jgi:hypothetical protein
MRSEFEDRDGTHGLNRLTNSVVPGHSARRYESLLSRKSDDGVNLVFWLPARKALFGVMAPAFNLRGRCSPAPYWAAALEVVSSAYPSPPFEVFCD